MNARKRLIAGRTCLAVALTMLPPPGFADGKDNGSVAWLEPALTYDGSALVNLRGGLDTGATYGGNLHLKLTAHGDALGWPGTSGFIDVLTIHGGRASRMVGDAQGVDNIDGPTGTQVEEFWVQHNFRGSGVSLLLGIYDTNSEFYRLSAAGLFLNSSFGVGPEFGQSGVEGPSIFPRTSAGLRVAVKPIANTVIRAAVLDGVPVVRPDGSRAAFRGGDGLLVISEFAVLARSADASLPQSGLRDRIGRFSSLAPYDDKIAVGVWRYTRRFADLSDTDATGKPLARHGSSGAYFVGERSLIGADATGTGRHLSAFVQAGFADARTNRFGGYVGAGVVGSGWGPVKDTDQLGVSVAHAQNGSHYLRAQAAQGVDRAETTFEVTYLTRVSKYVTVQPDLQYVKRPNTDPSIANALVLQMRFEIAF